MTVYTQVKEWTQPLRNLTVGVSMAVLVLTPSAPSFTPSVNPRILEERVEIIATMPDGNSNNIDSRTLYYRTSQGLNSVTYLTSVEQKEEGLERTNIPQMLREMSGLSVTALADLVDVSHTTYHKWLVGGGINPDHISRLTMLLDTFQVLRNLRIANLREFLETTGPHGKPLDLLTSGDFNAVIGLALRASSRFNAPPTISSEARKASGLPSRFRPARKLDWDITRMTGIEREEALDRLSPRPVPDEMVPVDNSDEDD